MYRWAILIILSLSSFSVSTTQHSLPEVLSEVPHPTLSEWDIFIQALIYTESRGDATAVGKANDAGTLQITPVYVKECNRLLGYEAFTLEDRFCPAKSLEMFELTNSVKNPERCILKAIKIHNPRAPKSYEQSILCNMKLIKYKMNS